MSIILTVERYRQSLNLFELCLYCLRVLKACQLLHLSCSRVTGHSWDVMGWDGTGDLSLHCPRPTL